MLRNTERLRGSYDSSAFNQRGDSTITRGDQLNKLGCAWTPGEKWPGSRVHGIQNLHRLLQPNPKGPLMKDKDGSPVMYSEGRPQTDRPGIVFSAKCVNAGHRAGVFLAGVLLDKQPPWAALAQPRTAKTGEQRPRKNEEKSWRQFADSCPLEGKSSDMTTDPSTDDSMKTTLANPIKTRLRPLLTTCLCLVALGQLLLTPNGHAEDGGIGNGNTAEGDFALSSVDINLATNNTAVGLGALGTDHSGSYNTANRRIRAELE